MERESQGTNRGTIAYISRRPLRGPKGRSERRGEANEGISEANEGAKRTKGPEGAKRTKGPEGAKRTKG